MQNPVDGIWETSSRPGVTIDTSNFALDVPTIVNLEVTIISDVDPFETATFNFVVRIVSSNCMKALQVPLSYSTDFIYYMFSTGSEGDSFKKIQDFNQVFNNNCRFEVSLFDTATMGPPNPIFGVEQPKFNITDETVNPTDFNDVLLWKPPKVTVATMDLTLDE